MTNIEFAKEICSIKESFEKMYHSIERYDMDKARELYQSYDEFMKRLGECFGIHTACSKRTGVRGRYKMPCIDMDGECWKDIEGYEGLYEVSNYGRVRCIRSKGHPTVLKPSKGNTGYLAVGLYKNGERRVVRVHVLVANAFLEKPNFRCEVSHIDESRTNNRVDNLVWESHFDNMRRPKVAERYYRTMNSKY